MSFVTSPAAGPRQADRVTNAFFALALLVFTCAYPFALPVNNPNENVRTYMTMAIVEDHTFRIDGIVEKYGWVNDMAAVPEPDGSRHLFSVKAPATSYFGVPAYWAMTKIAPRWGHAVPGKTATAAAREWWFTATTFVLRLFSVQLPCFAFLVWLERWLRNVTADRVLRLSAVAAACLGTNYVAYALTFASHAQFAITAFASFAIITWERALHPLDPKQRRLSRAFYAGLFAGLATLFEYHALPVSVCLAAYALTTFWRPTRLAMFGVGGLLSAGALMWFQWRCFKSPFTPGHKMSENPLYAHLLSQGYFGIGKPDWGVFQSIAFDRGYGFFGTSPFMWLGFLAIPFALFIGFGTAREQRQRRLATAAWMLTMLALWTTVSAAINWRGGWTVGPRYLGAAPPFFAYGAVCALEAIAGRSPWRRAVVRGLAGGAAVASVLTIGVVGLHFNTIPEEFTRPLVQFTWPMARAGFVPDHALEWFGVQSAWFWYVVAAACVAAGALAALAPWRERPATWAVRFAVFVPTLACAMVPALSLPEPGERGDLGSHARRSFVDMWRPQGRDKLPAMREEAERVGSRRPCAWVELARVEEMVGEMGEARRDISKAGSPAPECGGLVARADEVLLRHITLAHVPPEPPVAPPPLPMVPGLPPPPRAPREK